MSIVQTYRRYVTQLTASVDFLQSTLGRAWAGTVAVVQDGLAEGARQAFIQGLPGHPEQAEDSLNQVGADRGLFRYREETVASWSARVQNAWLHYEQAGTSIQVLRAINEWGGIVFPATWASGTVLTEDYWARFTVWIAAGNLPWGPPFAYGSGPVYGGTDVLYGVSNARTDDIATLRRLVNKWKPMRSRGRVVVTLSGPIIGDPALIVGSFVVGDGVALNLDC